ncbi:MAG: hypothetical protein EAX90_00685 [Candidatus Heimdallarchaeota archaeon]|nr:hypothetical protein [Candidatus Heimdallarchaeota archaeon]
MESYFPNHLYEEVDIDSIVKKKRRFIARRRLRYLILISFIGILTAIIIELTLLFVGFYSDKTTISIAVIFFGIPAGFLISLCNKKENLLLDIRDSFFSSLIFSASFIIIFFILKKFSAKFPNEMQIMFQTKLIILFIPFICIFFSFPWGVITGNFVVKRLKKKLQKAKYREDIK